jgi:hypothetical protein
VLSRYFCVGIGRFVVASYDRRLMVTAIFLSSPIFWAALIVSIRSWVWIPRSAFSLRDISRNILSFFDLSVVHRNLNPSYLGGNVVSAMQKLA